MLTLQWRVAVGELLAAAGFFDFVASWLCALPDTGRRAHGGSPRQPDADDAHGKLRDDLKNAYTELNKVTSERDRYRRLYDRATKKLSESQSENQNLKAQVQAQRDDGRQRLRELEQEREQLAYDNDRWCESYTTLDTSYQELVAQYHHLAAAGPDDGDGGPAGEPRGPRAPGGEGAAVAAVRRAAGADGAGPASSVPRTPGPAGVYKASGARVDDGFEDGNYHAHPVAR